MGHKLMIAMTACSLLIVAIMGTVSVTKSKELLEKYAFEHAKLSVDNHSKSLNVTIEKIQSSVDGLAVTTLAMLDDVEALKTDPAYVASFQEKVRPIADQFSKQTEGAMAFYIRFNPTYTAPTSGLFHADTNNDGTIEQLVPTDFSQYDPSDIEHVGWYYVPMKAKEGTWLDPYNNENINVKMISYVVPLFKDGEEIGVVGMDIRFDLFSDAVANMKTSPHSYGALLNANQQFLIHPTYTQQETLEKVNHGLSEQLKGQGSGVAAVNAGKQEEIVSFSRLANGQYLLLASPKEEVYKNVHFISKLIWIVAIISILISILLSLYLSGQLTKPMRLLVRDMKKVQNGDLTVRTDIIHNDEVGEAAANFNLMTEQLHGMATSIHDVSNKVREASIELSSTSQETAASTEEVTTSVDEIAIGNNEQARFIHNGASITRHLSEEFHGLASTTEHIQNAARQMMNEQQDGILILQNLVTTTEKNEQATGHIETVIHQLNQKTEHIVEVLQTIQTIADQTNLLALNAAIESARAGEAGKGFAVVANEIRSLANQSKEATDHIRQTVQDIYHDTTLTVDAMAQVKETTGEQTNAVTKVHDSIQHLSQSIYEISKQMGQHSDSIMTLNKEVEHLASEIENISAVSEEQAAASSEISTIMHQQAKDVEKVNTSIEQLHQLVNELQNMVKTFKL
ncbi:methyl-accepting chemotaxis protein [Bacillus sp. B190/17]|uniref:Methyl-accepting chemotaxis protein n=1 Tax=Bacillus lumedeiriae TaxID=3058829 RepID=A0ABW8IC72_9BACI